MTNTAPKRPSHRAFFEIRGRDGKTVSEIEIGAAWSHSDGKGLSLKLEVTPPAGSFISLRQASTEEGAQ